MIDRRSPERKGIIDRRVLIGTGAERAAVWGVVAALVVLFGVPALDALAFAPPEWTLLAVGLVTTLGAVGLAYSGGGIVPCLVLLFPPIAAGAAVVDAPFLTVPYVDPAVLPTRYAEPVIAATALAAVLGVAAFLVGRVAAFLVDRVRARLR